MGKHEDGYERADNDWYPTPPWATEALLSHIDISGLSIWECACGDGRMSEVLKAAGAHVYSSDVVDRGYAGLDTLIDFTTPHPAGLPSFSGMITNPPFGERGTLAVAFIQVALQNLGNGFCALLLPSDYNSAKTRAPLFGDCPQFVSKITLRKRCKWFDTPGSASPKENHAWFLWGAVPFKGMASPLPTIRYAPQLGASPRTESSPMLNLNRASLALEPINATLNNAIERATVEEAKSPKPFLGASMVGSECMRQVQFDWWRDPKHPARTKSIFARGNYFEEQTRRLLITAGFRFAPPEVLGFSAIGGALRGYVDGIVIHGPDLLSVGLSYPFIWEAKCINAKNWRALERDGLEKTYPKYAAQVALYQAYLVKPNTALFTATNADTCERLHFLVPFNAERAQMWSDRAVKIIEATRANELLPRAYDSSDNFHCRMCPHNDFCWRQP